MYIDNFKIALDEFDRVLDTLANAGRKQFGHNDDVITVDSTCKCIGHKFGTDITKDIKQVIFNEPATIVIFADGSKVCVKTCKNDKFDKEIGLVYALLKRAYADSVDDNGYLKATGLGEALKKVVADSIDQKAIKEQADAKRVEKKANRKDSRAKNVAKTEKNDVKEIEKKVSNKDASPKKTSTTK